MAIRLSREERAASSNRGAAQLPPLSPGFVHEVDAANWAHQEIGQRRAVEYGGVIVRDPAGLYFATQPVAGEGMQFDLRTVVGIGADGRYLQPPGYTCVATYHSHPAQHALILQKNRSFDERMAKAFLAFLSGADFYRDVHDRDFFPSSYLSGPDGSLIRHTPTGSPAEFSFALWVQAGKPANNPVGVYGGFDEFIKKISTFGSLSLIVPTALWGGSRGRIPADWKVFEPFSSTAVTEQPLFTAVFDQAPLAVTAALTSPTTFASEPRIGMVLKHLSQESYIATVASPKQEPLFSLDAMFPAGPDGQPRLPVGYRLDALYFNGWYEAGEVAARENWLASAFFSPAQIVAAVLQGQRTSGLQNPGRGLDLYMKASDQSLLKLKVPSATLATSLFKFDSEGVISDNGAQAALADGTLTPRNFVRRVINDTALWVVQAGELWRDVGQVHRQSALLALTPSIALSGAFVSSRDAALHAHEQIGNRRALYYGGYVLKKADGLFVITQPLQTLDHPFASTLFVPVGGQGPLIPPESYELHARYGSHTALSMVDPAWVRRRNWTQDDALINLQVFSDEEIHSIILDKRVAYLSGAEDCLLEYTPNQSPQEQLLLANISAAVESRRLGRGSGHGGIKPADWVVRLAGAGDFKIIQGNALWGPRGVVYSDWTPNFEYAPRLSPPDYVCYGAVFDSADEAARDLHQRVHGRNLPAQAYFAFIFKRQEKYVATEAVGVFFSNDLFKLGSLFSRKTGGGFLVPEGYELHALFRSQQWSPQGLSAANKWLTLYFLVPEVMYITLYEARRDRALSLPVYLSMLDGALLRYVPYTIDVKAGGKADTLLINARAQLDSGVTMPVDFVRAWALKGELRVLRTSLCWDMAGEVGGAWAGFQTISPRSLSPAFASPDDAARHAMVSVGRAFKRAYGGVILKLVNGLYVATEPLVMPPRGITLDWIYPDPTVSAGLYPGGSTIVARYRSLAVQEVQLLLSTTQKAVYQSMVPSDVLANLLRREAHIKCEYVLGPSGSILSYQLSNSAQETLLKGQLAPLNPVKGDLADNAIEQHIRSGTLSPQDFVNVVAKAGALRVVEGDTLWGIPRTLKPNFALNQYRADPLAIVAVAADSACSPLFTRALDAVRHVQRRWQPQDHVAVGYVLKAMGRELYMATLPLVREAYGNLRSVFTDGKLPQGYVLDGFYLCGSTKTIAPADDDMARSFFAPMAVTKALVFITSLRNGGVLPLYLLCADGALLRYTVPKTAPVTDWAAQVGHDSLQLRNGSLSVRDYVRRMATMGALEIRVTSEVWSRKQRVDAQWWPKRPPHAFRDDPYFHSFCGPLYFYADDAARYAQRLIGPFAGKQYLGAILVPPRLSAYVAIDPVENRPGFGDSTLELLFWVDHAGFDVPQNNVLRNYTIAAVHAFYNSIPSTTSANTIDTRLLPNFASSEDLRSYLSVVSSNSPNADAVYLSCRGGSLLKYVPALSAAETTLLNAQPAASPSALVSQLRRLGSLFVLVSDNFWKKRGRLDDSWSAEDPNAGEPWYGRAKDEL
ncbi:DUF4329 domain-containing protein [Pseudomonas tolaasii]|uniref:DUF4329 domain-containing protein n=1 Tax=Pseudomonas tolaasii TaxID=29442 RepID=UPI001C52AAD3|nr:DUF4329 domain-containing protein [Pseudomonas tolaasii]QXQ19423.1 DUF4329 domain-containing protein [Pseudomonas tolaasii]